jgi:TonB family protein
VRAATLASLLAAAIVAGCASAPPAQEDAWLDEDVLRACLGPRIPVELLGDGPRVKGVVLLEMNVLPSGRIQRVSIVTGSGNPALDEYLARRLGNFQCAPFEKVDATEPYTVEFELNLGSDD